jgi:hypothetical protein
VLHPLTINVYKRVNDWSQAIRNYIAIPTH